MKITYEISDGYVGGSRRQTMEIYPEDFDGLSSKEQSKLLLEIIHEDMIARIDPVYDEEKILTEIRRNLLV